MRRSSMIVSTMALASFIGAIWGCGDLLHSTDFTAPPEQTNRNDSPVNFCSWSRETAQGNAFHACSMLLACQNGFASDAPNAFGACVRQASLAYDCSIAPNHAVKGKTQKFWDCLWRAKTCTSEGGKENSVAECILDNDDKVLFKTCNGQADIVQCEGGNSRIECRAGIATANVDPCVASGRTCAQVGAKAFCAGSTTPTCAKSGCADKQLHWCVDGGTPQDHGLDCANFGGEQCDDIDAGAAGAWPACRPAAPVWPDGGPPDGSTVDAAPWSDGGPGNVCTPTKEVTCEGERFALGCPSGIQERVDCAGLGVNCVVTSDGDPFDVSRACANKAPPCRDRCEGKDLYMCIRGNTQPVKIECEKVGLGGCIDVTTADEKKTQATCSPPPPSPPAR